MLQVRNERFTLDYSPWNYNSVCITLTDFLGGFVDIHINMNTQDMSREGHMRAIRILHAATRYSYVEIGKAILAAEILAGIFPKGVHQDV